MSFVGGAAVERANSHLDAVESDLLRLAPDPYLRGTLPDLVAHVRAHLPPGDPRRERVEAVDYAVTKRPPEQQLTELERQQVLAAVRAASDEGRREIRRVRSFRNILAVTAFALTLAVAGVTLLGVLRPDVIPLCFAPNDTAVVCPTATTEITENTTPAAGQGNVETGEEAAAQARAVDDRMRDTAGPWDIPVVEIAGLLAAALASAFALRTIEGTSTPYSLPVAVAFLKLPAGALTAVVGLLLMRGGFVPGLSALDSSAQIIAWAVVFGYSQQLLTQFVDKQAKSVLDNVGGPQNAPLTAPAGRPPTPTPTSA
jgi:hypothetical protein